MTHKEAKKLKKGQKIWIADWNNTIKQTSFIQYKNKGIYYDKSDWMGILPGFCFFSKIEAETWALKRKKRWAEISLNLATANLNTWKKNLKRQAKELERKVAARKGYLTKIEKKLVFLLG